VSDAGNGQPYRVQRFGFTARTVTKREARELLAAHDCDGDLDAGFTYGEPLADGTPGGYLVTVTPIGPEKAV
jgi:hypothetical protein